MSDKKAIPQVAFDWYDAYAHGDIDRRTFMNRLASLGLGALGLVTFARGLAPNYALAEQVSFNDPDIVARYRTFPSPRGHGEGRGYWVEPASLSSAESDGRAAAVLVVHENRGLNPYIKDVARRLAKRGYVAFAPDALYSLGGYPGNDDEGRAMQRGLDREKILADFMAAAFYLENHPLGTGKVGVVGFCFGGYVSNELAARLPATISAAVPFYGTPPASLDLPPDVGPLLIHLADKDTRVNATWPAYEAALLARQADYTLHRYQQTQHGFHNDSTARYDAEAAELAWTRTLAFFDTHLR